MSEQQQLRGEHAAETCHGSQLHCFWHERDEPGEPWHVCFECKHNYLSAADLLAEHNRVLAEMGCDHRAIRAEAVFCCPFCLHDW